jgi:hypothetical protein
MVPKVLYAFTADSRSISLASLRRQTLTKQSIQIIATDPLPYRTSCCVALPQTLQSLTLVGRSSFPIASAFVAVVMDQMPSAFLSRFRRFEQYSKYYFDQLHDGTSGSHSRLSSSGISGIQERFGMATRFPGEVALIHLGE